MFRFNTILTGPHTTNGFTWVPGSVFFKSLYGLQNFSSNDGVIQTWTYLGDDIFPEGKENNRINLWLFNAVPPAGNVEVVIESFTFIPYP
jgi:hypothetical protein